MKLYITELSIWALVIFYLPLVCWLLCLIWRGRKLRDAWKVLVIPAVAAVAYAIPMTDVTMNSLAMAKACPQAGLHVYKKTPVEGYYDDLSGVNELGRYGYRFIENRAPGDRRVMHLERQSNGAIAELFLEVPSAEYEVIYDPMKLEDGVRKQRSWVRHKPTGDSLGEKVAFGAVPGWIDRALVLKLFGGSSIGGCTVRGEAVEHWVMEIIPPKRVE